jgi:foldase protein PrsA
VLVRRLASDRRIVAAVVLAAALVITFAGYAIGRGLGAPDIPSDAVAVVDDAPNGTITTANFEAGLKQAAARQGVNKVPKPSDPQYESLRDSAMSDLLLSRWVRGEAEERGITVSDTEVTSRLEQIKKQQFKSEQQFQQFLDQAGFTPQDARERVELQLLSGRIQAEILPEKPSVSQGQVESFYKANISQFQQPETRDVRQIFNQDKAKVEQAKTLLSKDDSAQSWEQVAARLSADPATKDNGGLREGVTRGQSEAVSEEAIFSAPQGQLVGPVKGQDGYYLIEVEKITPPATTPLSSVSKQIEQQLSQGAQQDVATSFQTSFTAKWTSRSFCASGYVMNRCANYTSSDACVGDDPGEQGDVDKTGCVAFVTSTAPLEPGHATVFPGQAPQGLAQGPIRPVSGQSNVIGPSGAPQAPGAVPPGGTAAPPGGTAQPPTGTPPGG